MRYAERKLTLCLGYSVDSEPRIHEILGEGNDPAFDKIIASLGYIARRKPKPVIDSVMFWRKSKSEAAAAAATQANGGGSGSNSSSPAQSHSRGGSRTDVSSATIIDPKSGQADAREAAIMADRKSLVSIFILCRVLMEVVRQTPPDVLGNDLSEKLEEIVFKQLRSAEPDLIAGSAIRRANWNLFAELLGEMSGSRFISVGDRFIADLEKVPHTLSKEKEVGVQLVIHGMRYLKLSLYPMDLLEETANFLESLAKFFARTQSNRIKVAYADVISHMVLPIAGVATAELNYPVWVEAIDSLFGKTMEMLQRPKSWHSAYLLATTLLSVAPQELFARNWLSVFEANSSRLKERGSRATFYTGATRLLWVFMCRCTESLNNTTKKLDVVSKSLLSPNNKKLWTVPDANVNPPCIYLIRVAAYGYRQYVLENFLFQLLHNSPSGATELTSLDSIVPERAIISIRSFVLILNDCECGERPPFPTDDILNQLLDDPVLRNAPKVPKPTGSFLEFYETFSNAVSKILFLCDGFLGPQASSTDEKPASSKTPMAVSFHFGNSDNNSQNQKQLYTELFCAVLESVPWLHTTDGSYNKIIDTLCRNCVHSNSKIANCASVALKNLAKIRDTRSIVVIFTKLLFSFDEKLFTNQESSLNTMSEYERLLRVYVELLEIWIEKIRASCATASNINNNNNANSPNTKSDVPNGGEEDSGGAKCAGDEAMLNSWWPSIEEVEGNGLYFLCSQDRSIRHLAIRILRLTTEFDNALQEHEEHSDKSHSRKPSRNNLAPPQRLISFLEQVDISQLFEKSKPEVVLSMPERNRLSKLSSKKKETLLRTAESDYGVDTALWLKAFPQFMKECFENYPIPVAIARNVVCVRLVHMHDSILEFMRVENPSVTATNTQSLGLTSKHSMRTHHEVIVEQWRNYLIVACLTMTLTDEQKMHIPDSQYQHGRKKSVQKITIHHQRITSVRSVFRMVIPLLGVDHPTIRDAIVSGLSCINVNIYKALVECIKPTIDTWRQETRKPGSSHMINPGSRRDPNTGYRQDRIITEVAHVFKVTAHYLSDPMIYEDEWIVSEIVNFLRDLRSFLALSEVQTTWDYQRLRRYFCGIVEGIYCGVNKSEESRKNISFDTRAKFFNLIEEWCFSGSKYTLARDREAIMKQTALNSTKDSRERNLVLASMELEKRKSEITIVSSMASLCYGSISDSDNNDDGDNSGSQKTQEFDLDGLLTWIDTLLRDSREEMQQIGRRGLKNLLLTNPDNSHIFEETVGNCYRVFNNPQTARNYFATVAGVLLENPDYPTEVRQPLTLGLFKSGDEDYETRALAARLLEATEMRFYGFSCIQEFKSSITSKTMVIYKRALFNLSTRFATDHSEDAFMIFSELTKMFHRVSDMSRRDILAVLLPWVQTVELKVEVNEAPSPSAVMVICNLLEITVAFSDRIQNEVEALWVALANGRYPGNIKVVMDFIIQCSLAKRDTGLVNQSRKIMLYLTSTASGYTLVNTLLGYLRPKNMIPHHPDPHDLTVAKSMYPHVAEISDFLPKTKEATFSYGQLGMIYLVDLVLSPQAEVIKESLPLILHASFVLLDHYLPIVHEQARELLVLIIHAFGGNEKGVSLCDKLRHKDSNSYWVYDDLNSGKDGARTPVAMNQMVIEVLDVFEDIIPGIKKMWARSALSWATTCPVRHIACRSFQVFRCLLSFLDQSMLADMLARLSNTISDNTPDIQGFAMQILMTLNAVTCELDSEELINFPQLFWATVACLSSMHEQEFIEVLSILEKFLSKIDLDSPDTVSCLASTFPPKWEGKFNGLQEAVMHGLRSSKAWEPTLRVLDRLNQLHPSEIIAGSNRLIIAVATNIPRYLHALETNDFSSEVVTSAERLRELCDEQDLVGLSRILSSLIKGRFRTKKDFINQIAQVMRTQFFPNAEVPLLTFFLGILSNKTRWVKIEAMEMLKLLFPMVDLQKDEFAGVGADIISPLLRLLQTDFAEQALSVLDEAASIPSSNMDKHVLRMSLGNRTIRKEYERTATMFGIPDESGWAVPMPAIASNRTRNNVHAVFYTCSVSNENEEQQGEEPVSADEFQFHKEEYGNNTDGDSASITEEGSLSHMWTALDNLDSFFARDMKKTTSNQAYHTHTVSVTDTEMSTEAPIDPVDSAPQVYDKKVSVILNRSLARTPSTTSFKTSLADSFGNSSAQRGLGVFYGSGSTNQFHYPRSRRREPTEFDKHGRGLGGGSSGMNTAESSDVDTEEEIQSSKYKGMYMHDPDSFDTIRYSDEKNSLSTPNGSGGSNSPHGLSAMDSRDQMNRKDNGNQTQESSFRLESLLKGASNIGKKKKHHLHHHGHDKEDKKEKEKKEKKEKKMAASPSQSYLWDEGVHSNSSPISSNRKETNTHQSFQFPPPGAR